MKKCYIYAGISILCWSTVAVISKLLLGNINNIQLLWASSLFAAASLLFANVKTGSIRVLKTYRFKDYLITVLIGFPGTFLYYVFYYGGTARMPASQAFIINYLWPIMSVIFACILLPEKITWRKGVAIVVSFFGVAVVAGTEILQFNRNGLMGALFCVLGAVSYGLYAALNKKIEYVRSVSTMLNFTVTFLVTTAINFLKGDLFVPTPIQFAGFAWNGIATMAVAGTLWMLALKEENTAKIANLAYITPFISLVWTSLILREEISLNSIVGLVMIVLGILFQLREKPQKAALPATE